MSNQKSNVNSTVGLTSAGGGKFANRNLNMSARPIASRDKLAGSTVRGNFIAQGTKTKFAKAVGAAAAPTPLNTPSIKRENNGKDINVPLVPVGNSAVWGLTGENKQNAQLTSVTEVPPESSPVVTNKTAPWTKAQDHSENSIANDVKNKKPVTPSKSWADAESDEDDEEGTSAPSPVPRVAPLVSVNTSQSTFAYAREPSKVDHDGNMKLRPNYQNTGFQRERSNSGNYSSNQHSNSHYGHYHQYNEHRGNFDTHRSGFDNLPPRLSAADELERQQQRAIEVSRQELEHLEHRKLRNQELQQMSQQPHHGSRMHQQFSNTSQFNGDFLRGQNGSTSQFSGSGLLNSTSSKQMNEEPLTWERAKRRPIEAPTATVNAFGFSQSKFDPRIASRPPPPPQTMSPSANHLNYNSYNQFQHQQQSFSAGLSASNQYPQMLRPTTRSRGPSEDLTAVSRSQVENEIRHTSSAIAITATTVDPSKSFASLFPKAATEVTRDVVSGDAADDLVSNDDNIEETTIRVQKRHQMDRYRTLSESEAPSGSRPQRKMMLFEPKSGQFVESTNILSEGTIAKTSNKQYSNGPAATKTESEGKWSRVPRKLSGNSETVTTVALDQSTPKYPTAVLTRSPRDASVAVAEMVFESASSKLAAAETRFAEIEATKISERTTEKQTRGPRTLGLLFRFIQGAGTADEDIEQVLSASEIASKDTDKSTGAHKCSDDSSHGSEQNHVKRSATSGGLSKERKPKLLKKAPLIKVVKNNNKMLVSKGTEDTAASAFESALLTLDSSSSLLLDGATSEPASSRMNWAQGSGLQMLQPQQNPDVVLDSSLSFGGILSSSKSYTDFDANDSLGANYYVLDGVDTRLTTAFEGLSTAPSIDFTSSVESAQIENNVVRVKRAVVREKFAKSTVASGTHKRSVNSSKTGGDVAKPARHIQSETDNNISFKSKNGTYSKGGRGGGSGRSSSSNRGPPPRDEASSNSRSHEEV